MTNRKKTIVLSAYIACLLIIVVLKFYGDFSAFYLNIQNNLAYYHVFHQFPSNLVPFRTLRMYITDLPSPIAWGNLLGVVLPWIPLGVLSRWRFSKAKRSRVLIGLALSCLAGELLQQITFTGSFDVDDWILQFLSCFIGVILSETLFRKD